MKRMLIFSICLLTASSLMALSVKAQKPPKLSDPEIASVAVVANQVDVQAAEQAQKKSKTPAVLDFAKTMIADHTSVIQKASDLVKKLGVTPKSSATSRKLASDGQMTRRKLQAKSGRAFDKAYVDNEVAYHKAVISTVSDVLIPQSQNAELKALLESVLPIFRTHLEHAEMIQKQIAGK
ncbi:MAG: DUF4142 domain-containing protein [Flavisolibacter sp.]